MQIVTLDFETLFGDDYTLSKMSTEAYIRDPRFEAHGCAIKYQNQEKAQWWSGEELKNVFRNTNWNSIAVLCHHAQFDGFILSHHFHVKPKFWFDTLSMARLLLGNHLSVSLDSVRKHFGMPFKVTPYNLFKGRHWNELTPAVQQQVAAGAIDEVESIWKIFNLLGKNFPKEEYQVIDTTIRMFTEPVLGADVDMLAKLWESEAGKKQQRLEQLGITESELQSAERFADLLRQQGIEPELKQGKNGDIYAFAKTDDFMRELQEHDDENVRALAEARLGVKSTLLQTRAETLGFMARRGPLPVYLRYAGAGTLRVSGGDGANWLNFKRRSAIRKAILAPPGYLLAPIDSSQIEFRVCNYLAGQEDVIQQLRDGKDPYLPGACEFYGEEIYKANDEDPRKAEMDMKRGMSKQANLMCIYGAAGEKFQATAKAGLYGPPVNLERKDADKWVRIFRDMHPAICAKGTGYWAQAGRILARLAGGPPIDWGILHVRDKRIYLPNGCPLIYDTLEYFKPPPEERHKYGPYAQDGHWRVRTRHGWKELWGSKLVQNICEAVSRVIVSQAMNRITAMGYRVLNWPYDELLCLIPKDGREEWHLERCMAEMRRPVTWLPGLPLDCEGSLGERYSK